jgi:nitrogen fixation/metabolism regulation signal transduction histidine kinase
MRRFGKFEMKIISALLVTAAAPLVFTWLMIDRLVAESMAVGLNEQVLSSLRAGVDLYKEVIESRMRIVRQQGAHLAGEPAFRQAVGQSDTEVLRTRLEDLVASTSWISQTRLLRGGDELLRVASPVSFAAGEWKSKRDRWPVTGEVELEVTFVIAEQFLAASGELRELVLTLENLHANFQPWKMGYYRLFLYIYLGILLAAVVLGFLLARSVTKRIAQVVKANKLASAGDLAVRVGFRSRDEIGSLAESFNQMMDDIQSSRDRIVYLEKISSWQEIARRLAHEIKNPLTPIQLAIQELHRTYRGEDPAFRSKLDDSLEIVEEEVGTLRRMVETFSEFARMPTVASEPADLNAFASDFLKLHPQYSGRVELVLAPGPVPVLLDRILMGRVLSNLIDNGLDASPAEATVDVQVARVDGWGMISVIDRGSGLSEEARGHLFQPYFTSKAQGTGLGLAIVKKIVLQHGGEIAVSDGETRGTVFTVRLRTVLSAKLVPTDGGS